MKSISFYLERFQRHGVLKNVQLCGPRWHERSQTVRTDRQTATLEVWGGGGRGNQTPTASPEATAIGW